MTTSVVPSLPRVEEKYVPTPLQYYEITPTRRIAYRHHVGVKEPTILYIPGFFSDMELSKVVLLEKYARGNGFSSLRYDQECSGKSTGDQTTIEFEHWVEDAMIMLNEHVRGPVVLVASSLGCWISTIIALRHPDRIKGMLFLGPGFNCLWTGYWFHYNLLPPEVREKVDRGEEQVKIKMKYGGWGILRKDFCERTRDFEIDFEEPVEVDAPVRIIHGIRDYDVPHEFCLMAMERFTSKDVEVIYRKMGDHRLMSPIDLNLISHELDRLLKHVSALDSGLRAAPPILAKL
jgi:abhydrolase domain-containing protein 10